VITATDLFCGAGGSSLGASVTGRVRVEMAANHWQTAIDVHQAHFPDTRHDCADITQVDPRRYPRTDILIASPECTNHSAARGVSRRRQDPTLWDAPDPSAERSRATMWDVVRFSEQMAYRAVVVENVVEVAKWVCWSAWRQAMADLGYDSRVVSANSQDFGVAQSRDRVYIVFWRRGATPPDLDPERVAWCDRCGSVQTCRQAWKPGRALGRYRSQWQWRCTSCHDVAEPPKAPASSIIDWSIDCPRIGDRKRPIAPNTRARIAAGLARHGWRPITTVGAGNGFETTPGNRSRPLTEPVPTQTTTSGTALAMPAEFLLQTAHGGRIHELDEPHPTVCASDDRLSLIVGLRGTAAGQVEGSAHPTSEPLRTVSAGGTHHGLLVGNNTNNVPIPTEQPIGVSEPIHTQTTRDSSGLLVPDEVIDLARFRMLEPCEVAAAMAFPKGYIPRKLSKRDRVKLAGNAVTPPVMTWLIDRVCDALEADV